MILLYKYGQYDHILITLIPRISNNLSPPYLHGHVDGEGGIKVIHLDRLLLADTIHATDSLRVNLRIEPAIEGGLKLVRGLES